MIDGGAVFAAKAGDNFGKRDSLAHTAYALASGPDVFPRLGVVLGVLEIGLLVLGHIRRIIARRNQAGSQPVGGNPGDTPGRDDILGEALSLLVQPLKRAVPQSASTLWSSERSLKLTPACARATPRRVPSRS